MTTVTRMSGNKSVSSPHQTKHSPVLVIKNGQLVQCLTSFRRNVTVLADFTFKPAGFNTDLIGRFCFLSKSSPGARQKNTDQSSDK
jgi:hypothetical protein